MSSLKPAKRKAIIVDLDGTLCNNDHRKHHIEGDKKDWNAFNASCSEDTLHEWCATLIDAMAFVGVVPIFVSGRTDDYKEQTKAWLEKHNYERLPLFMRREGDFRKDSLIKAEIYRQEIEPHFEVIFCVDDRQQVVDMWRNIGLTCLQCAEGNF